MARLALSASLVLLLLLGACVPPPAPTPPPPIAAPAPVAPPPPIIAVEFPIELPDNWADLPRTEGDWVYRQGDAGGAALFSTPAGEPLLLFGCSTDSGRVVLMRYSRPLPAQVRLDVRTETAARSVDLQRTTDGTGALWALPANDPLLDAIAFSRGHFAVGLSNAAPIYPPSFPEITRVIEDCR
jgi:hypothetical protein